MEPKRSYNLSRSRIALRMLLIIVFSFYFFSSSGQERMISSKNIQFIPYPGFPEGESTWDDIGYDAKYNTVYIAVTNHRNHQGLYEYNVSANKMELEGFLDKLARLRVFQWQGKVHTKIIADPEGNVYFGTDGGEDRQLYLMDGPHGYGGGFFMKWVPSQKELINLGMGLKYESLKDIDIDPSTGNIYAITFPQVHFLIYNPQTNNLQDLGRLGSGHVPRVMFTDNWGNCYYVDWRQRLVKYDKGLHKLIFARESLPAFQGTPGECIITGITAYAKDKKDGIIYFTTYGGKLIAFHPQKEGIGSVVDLGGVVDKSDLGPGIPFWHAYTPDLALGKNGKLYYLVGSEGRYAQKDTVLFVEFDPETEEKRILFKYSTKVIGYVSGSNTTDKEGNVYFGAFRTIKKNDQLKDIPFLIKFNPEKKVQK